MLFKNKIEYTKGMFVEIYGTEIKKKYVWYCGSLQGLLLWLRSLL